ncbi:hypothetical protein [Fuscovulum blasticum]|uniref:hypothetical protein n=1 Tax=Fuscovulum blasticum TaxID=1075 RepID=UPI000D3EC26D|nr:hypothetical protein [Fuscovulum blasticum]AWD22745.1 hypothetical protein B6K69_14550 [Fuscovulum blasticum]
MKPVPTYVQDKDESTLMFSVCSLVRDQAKYDRLLESFERFGFTLDKAEFLAADNREGNQFHGFSWHKQMLPRCKGRYVIFCHEDVELVDRGYDDLVAAIEALEEADPKWLVAGVAGSPWRPLNHSVTAQALHISDVFGNDRRRGNVPCRVESLDECFLLMRRLKPVLNSYDMQGFHYYGADLCLQAEFLGGRAYAIDFHLHHYGRAIADENFHRLRQEMAQKYRRWFPGRILHCVTGRVALGGGWYEAR